MKEGLILFAHGSRDPDWFLPFEQIALGLKKRNPAIAVAMAYLEHGASLEEAVGVLAAKGAVSIRVVPVFLGQGGHVKQDLPRLFAGTASAFPNLKFVLDKAIGEQPQVIEAITEFISARR